MPSVRPQVSGHGGEGKNEEGATLVSQTVESGGRSGDTVRVRDEREKGDSPREARSSCKQVWGFLFSECIAWTCEREEL